MRLGRVDTAERIAVVAEIGNNHEGDPGAARELVEQAAAAGAHAVKLQVFVPRLYVAPSQPERVAQLERFALGDETVRELADLARERGLGFVCTAFDLESAALIAPLVDAVKIASGDNDVDVLLEAAARSGKPVIVSTGMSTWEQIGHAVDVLAGVQLALLHCVSAYPIAHERASLATIAELRERYRTTVGYSDHTLGLEACVTAAALGARILEKHFTLQRGVSEFRDHELSAEPAELAELVERVAAVEALVGEPRAGVLEEEEPVFAAARRTPRASRALPAGHVLEPADVVWLRPREGPPDSPVGRRLTRDVSAGDALTQTGGLE